MALIKKKENYHQLSTKRESYLACAFKSKPWNSPLFSFPFLWISTDDSEVTNRTERKGWFYIGTSQFFFLQNSNFHIKKDIISFGIYQFYLAEYVVI